MTIDITLKAATAIVQFTLNPINLGFEGVYALFDGVALPSMTAALQGKVKAVSLQNAEPECYCLMRKLSILLTLALSPCIKPLLSLLPGSFKKKCLLLYNSLFH